MDELRRAFNKYDHDHNGYISLDEAHKVLHSELGFNEDKTRKFISVYDRNKDGRLDYEEFIWFYWKLQEKKSELLQIFKKFDKNNDDCVSFSEVQTILKDFQFSDVEIRDLMRLHDTNQDGQLQFAEFIHFWTECCGKIDRQQQLS